MKNLFLVFLCLLVLLIQNLKDGDFKPPTRRGPSSLLEENNKSFNFSFNYKSEKFVVSVDKGNYNQALEEASTKCFNHYTKTSGNEKVKLPEDEAMELLNACVNPK